MNLADTEMLLKYLVKWDEVKMNRLISEEWVRHDMINCCYNMPRIAAVLRYIAGWDITSLGLTAYDLEECSSVKYYMTE